MSRSSYTVSQSESNFTLTNTNNVNETILINEEHPKYNWISELAPYRIVNITETGRWTSNKDYNNDYGVTYDGNTNTSKVCIPVEVKLTRLDDLNIDESLFNTMETGTIVDDFVSSDKGFLPGTMIMAAGAPGVGKTSILVELLCRLHNNGKKVLFISAEMNQIDMARYLKRFPQWGQLPILFLSDYTEQCPKAVIEATLNQGWDMVLTDSYTEVNDTVKDACNLTRSKTEKWFLDLMSAHNKGNNETKTYTSFITILQLSKGGTFVGSNKLKHMTSAMLHLDWDGSENSGRRYMEFSKNRMGNVGHKLYYDLDGGVNFDTERYNRDLHNQEMVAEERKSLKDESVSFDKLFFGDSIVPEELKTPIEL